MICSGSKNRALYALLFAAFSAKNGTSRSSLCYTVNRLRPLRAAEKPKIQPVSAATAEFCVKSLGACDCGILAIFFVFRYALSRPQTDKRSISMITISERREQESAKNFVLRVLIDNIVNTRLEPGEKLNEPELCEQLGVSRTPFREAELELAQRRLIEIRPKIGTYVSLIDAELVEEVRHLRAVLEAEIARMACEKLTPADIDQLWENVALWRMYIERAQEEKIFELDKGFHRLLYVQCGCPYWYDLVENLAPHFDRTTILSFRCRPAKTIYEDHVSLLKAIEQKDAAAAHRIAGQHMQRYTENLSAIREAFPHYFKA